MTHPRFKKGDKVYILCDTNRGRGKRGSALLPFKVYRVHKKRDKMSGEAIYTGRIQGCTVTVGESSLASYPQAVALILRWK